MIPRLSGWRKPQSRMSATDIAGIRKNGGLEKSGSQIEAVRRHDQRDRQTNTTKYGDHLKDLGVGCLRVR
jgi:hypothetical protein